MGLISFKRFVAKLLAHLHARKTQACQALTNRRVKRNVIDSEITNAKSE